MPARISVAAAMLAFLASFQAFSGPITNAGDLSPEVASTAGPAPLPTAPSGSFIWD
ncbi:hypothetical protein [Actinoplanes teichomyceticus]|uniref:hypothetical protein n=1 Tax=Actinoplanes teichomyceticus TaxID=1867 RepID=UPI0013DDD8A7|nr:hypothetical protein [Actinoplanes teichomyceticus]GIF13023.1 hypothetical protein Ate01nite_30550 [Actinoplanes teichomyceticus]